MLPQKGQFLFQSPAQYVLRQLKQRYGLTGDSVPGEPQKGQFLSYSSLT